MCKIKSIIMIVAVFLLFSCKTDQKSQTENNSISQKEGTQEKKSAIILDVEKLLSHLEKDFKFRETRPKNIKEHYDIGDGDQYDNYFLEGSNLHGKGKTLYNFSFEEGTLGYITYKASKDLDALNNLLDSRFGEGVVSEHFKTIKEWKTDNFTIKLDSKEATYELNFEPLDYYPEF